ncbi:hypothetical protein [Planomonospora sp. ID82291]|uniref:hypothetical protein n=1 Tax=Planomonospora sp. ID82291 TaxID=2738136 RepID=UPI0018C37BBD|nr:hypothetical protein [Planomonospora sp. ID82291]MBG0819025.1 hypothetical protein [Planomonospora sp. ID82291]
MERLPADALIHTTAEQRADPWPREYELLTQILEEVAVLAAEQRRPKMREVKRPEWVTGKTGGRAGMDRAFAMMAATANVIK